MRRSKTENISSAMQRYIKALGIDRKLLEVKIINQWEDYVGKFVAQATTQLTIHQGVLYIKMPSSTIRNEIMMIRQGLIDSINDSVGEKIITRIVVK